jgi:hypothetical protein
MQVTGRCAVSKYIINKMHALTCVSIIYNNIKFPVISRVSIDFLYSNYCWEEEVKAALEREKAGEAKVLPILLRPAAWQDTQLSQFQLLPTGAKYTTA